MMITMKTMSALSATVQAKGCGMVLLATNARELAGIQSNTGAMMNIEAMKQALDALEYFFVDNTEFQKQIDDASLALRQAIAEAKRQEPVAYMYPDDLEDFKTREMSAHAYSLEMVSPTQGETVPLYTYPQPKHEWIGLTDEEINKLEYATDTLQFPDTVKEIEAKLKEKNT